MRQYCVYSSVAAAESFLAPCRQPYHVSTRERETETWTGREKEMATETGTEPETGKETEVEATVLLLLGPIPHSGGTMIADTVPIVDHRIRATDPGTQTADGENPKEMGLQITTEGPPTVVLTSIKIHAALDFVSRPTLGLHSMN